MRYETTLRVPVQLLELCLREKIINQFRVYLCMKRRCVGQMRLSPEMVKEIADEIGVHQATVLRYIETMKKKNWIGYNPNSGMYFIRGWSYILGVEKLEGRSGVEVDFDSDIKNLRALAFAAATSHYMKVRERTGHKRSGSKQQSSETSEDNEKPINLGAFVEKSAFNKLGVVELGQRFNVTPMCISNWKKRAKELGYLEYQHNFVKTGFTVSFLPMLLKCFDHLAHKFVCYSGEVYLQCTDSFVSDMLFSTGKYW